MISFKDFQKLDLRVAKIKKAEKVKGSEKLLKLEIDLGNERRQIIAGLAKNYSTAELKNKEVVVLVNLEPKEILGLKSEGMLLAADDNGPILLVPEKEVSLGTKIF